MKPLYSRAMNEAFFTDLSTWLTQAGLAGTSGKPTSCLDVATVALQPDCLWAGLRCLSTSKVGSFLWDDTRCAVCHRHRSCLRLIMMRSAAYQLSISYHELTR